MSLDTVLLSNLSTLENLAMFTMFFITKGKYILVVQALLDHASSPLHDPVSPVICFFTGNQVRLF